jgi:hypothetical protein
VFDTIKVNSVLITAMDKSTIIVLHRGQFRICLLYDFSELSFVDASQNFKFTGSFVQSAVTLRLSAFCARRLFMCSV